MSNNCIAKWTMPDGVCSFSCLVHKFLFMQSWTLSTREGPEESQLSHLLQPNTTSDYPWLISSVFMDFPEQRLTIGKFSSLMKTLSLVCKYKISYENFRPFLFLISMETKTNYLVFNKQHSIGLEKLQLSIIVLFPQLSFPQSFDSLFPDIFIIFVSPKLFDILCKCHVKYERSNNTNIIISQSDVRSFTPPAVCSQQEENEAGCCRSPLWFQLLFNFSLKLLLFRTCSSLLSGCLVFSGINDQLTKKRCFTFNPNSKVF